MAIVDSKAAFKARAISFGITEAQVAALEAQDLATFAAFAFLGPYNPNSPDDAGLKASLTDILGAEPSAGGMAKFRRVQFESYTQMLADTKARLERTDDTVARRMPAPERAARHKDQIRRLVSVQITQDNEPSHNLLDLAQQMVEDQLIKHISLDKCTSRVLELRGLKGSDALADISSDYKLRQAFLRRSLAFDQAALIGFDTHERWVNSLFGAVARPPPLNHNSVSWEQVFEADRELFYFLGEECRDGVGLSSSGTKIVEDAMKRLMVDIRVTFLLTPTMGGSSSSAAKRTLVAAAGVPAVSKSAAKRARKAAAAALGNTVAARGAPLVAPKGKGKGKGKGKDRPSLPPGLEGCWSNVDGENVCMDFQFGRCSEVAAGQKCSKGLRKCCIPRCKGLHGHFECPNKANLQR